LVEVNPRATAGVRMAGANGANDGVGQKHSWRTWQSDEDIPQRKILIQHMCVRDANDARGTAEEGREGSIARRAARDRSRRRANG
jgi:hypothetical protein